MVSPDVCQQLVDEPTHQSSRCVNSSYELRDHLCKQREWESLETLRWCSAALLRRCLRLFLRVLLSGTPRRWLISYRPRFTVFSYANFRVVMRTMCWSTHVGWGATTCGCCVCKQDNVYNSVLISLFILWLNLVCFIKITEMLAPGMKFALQRKGWKTRRVFWSPSSPTTNRTQPMIKANICGASLVPVATCLSG